MKLLLKIFATAGCAAVLIAAATLASRYYLTRELSDRATDAEQADPAMLSGLAQLDRAGLAELAAAAASTDHEVAMSARREIQRLVARWHRLGRGDTEFDAQRRLLQMVDELLSFVDRFGPAGRVWLAKVADQMLSGTEGNDVRLAQQCDQLLSLARLPTNTSDPKQLAESSTIFRAQQQRSTLHTNPSTDSPPLTWQPSRPIENITSPQPPAKRLQQQAGPGEAKFVVNEPTNSVPQALPAIPAAIPMSDAASPNTTHQVLPSEPSAPGDLAWQTPTAAGPATSHRVGESTSPSIISLPITTALLVSVPDRMLIEASVGTETKGFVPMKALMHQILVSRGFASTTTEQLLQVIAPDMQARLRLIDNLLERREGDTVRMLLLLASDAAPPVRVAAISALGSSQDRRLVETAWQLAIRDRDPRVAKIANELRSRR